MSSDETEDRTIYKVVVNHEEQYSIWRADRENAPGWSDAGKAGPKLECLEYIEAIWTDMRPASLRKHMEEEERRRGEAGAEPEAPPADAGPSLVERLCKGQHRVVASLRPEKTARALEECIERGFVFVEFTETRGRTGLGFRLDRERMDLSGGDFGRATGSVLLAGNLTLDEVPVRCVARIDLARLDGEGHLELR